MQRLGVFGRNQERRVTELDSSLQIERTREATSACYDQTGYETTSETHPRAHRLLEVLLEVGLLLSHERDHLGDNILDDRSILEQRERVRLYLDQERVVLLLRLCTSERPRNRSVSSDLALVSARESTVRTFAGSMRNVLDMFEQ